MSPDWPDSFSGWRNVLFSGFTWPTPKSFWLLLVSMQPKPLRTTASDELIVGVGPAPSKHVVPVP